MITPLDIENKNLIFNNKQMVNGYSVDEVDDFLDDLTVEYEKIFKENSEYKSELEKLKEDMQHYKAIESTLQSTLVMAQTTAEEVKEVAKQQADKIIAEEKESAEKEVASLNSQISLKQKELEDVQKQFDVYKAKMESLLISQLELLKEINKE